MTKSNLHHPPPARQAVARRLKNGSVQRQNILYQDVSSLIDQSRQIVVAQGSQLTISLFWHIGKRINDDVLGGNRADYGKQIVSRLATQLSWAHIVEIHGTFEAAYSGQMKLYLNWLNRYERQEGENELVGLILCTGGNREQIELKEQQQTICLN
jgi:hypothetical protein